MHLKWNSIGFDLFRIMEELPQNGMIFLIELVPLFFLAGSHREHSTPDGIRHAIMEMYAKEEP